MNLRLCFMLYVLMAAGTSLAVDVNWLTKLVEFIKSKYQIPNRHFSLAVTIPQQQDLNTLDQVLEGDNPENVKMSVDGSEVYIGRRMVFSVPLEPVHAERLVLQNLNHLQYTENDFLLIYSYLSPCSKCTDRKNKYNIVELIEKHAYGWNDAAFVFTKVFTDPKDGSTVSRNDLINSLTELCYSMGGFDYIFRCDGLTQFECHSCSAGDKISEFCVDNNAAPELIGSSGRQSSISRERSRSSSGSRGRSRSSSGSRGRSRSGEEGICRSQSESSISSGNSGKAGKHEGEGRNSRMTSKNKSSVSRERSRSSSGSRGRRAEGGGRRSSRSSG